ncbi:MAG: hypothetical protein FADNKDHG_01525 [Holosporales bacterium]
MNDEIKFSINKLKKGLEKTGFFQFEKKFLKLCKPCLKIRLTERKAEIGSSKIGGMPHLPENFEYPKINDIPLRFLMQINLTEIIVEIRQSLNLPEKGILYFFISNDDDSELIKNKIVYLTGPANFCHSIDFGDYYDRYNFLESAVDFEFDLSLPQYGEIYNDSFWEKINSDKYDELLHFLVGDSYYECTQFGGYPTRVYNYTINEIQTRALFFYFNRSFDYIDFLKKPEYPCYDIETAQRMGLKLLAQEYEEKYNAQLNRHLEVKGWFDERSRDLHKFKHLLTFSSHEKLNIFWWDSNEINFFVFDQEIENLSFKKTYAFIDPS